MKKKLILAVALTGLGFGLTGYSATNYVDRTRPDDAGDGLSWTTAKRTIQAAVNTAATSDTVLVAPGTYDEGMTVTPGGYLSNRVMVAKNILLQSRDGAATTVIQGAKDYSVNAYGCGTNAIRCIYMTTGTLKGFTLTGGATSPDGKQSINDKGGALYGPNTSAPDVYDCILSNNASLRGGGAFGGALHRCLIAGNYANNNSSALRESRAYDCLIVNHTGPSVIGYTHDAEGVVNCTIARNSGIALDNSKAYNCIITENGGNVANSSELVMNCCISSTAGVSTGSNNIVAADAKFVDSANRDFRLLMNSPCLDIANTNLFGSAGAPAARTDYLGQPRLQGSGLDIGAIEGGSPGVAAVTAVKQGTGSGSIAPEGRLVLATLPTQLVFTATAEAGSALRHFTVNGGKQKNSGDTFTLTVTQPSDFTVAAVFYPARYVDAVNGDDANDGTATNTAWRTLQYAVNSAAAGTLVLAAPGTYNEGSAYAALHSNRVVITSNIILKGSKGPEQTFIVGAMDPTGNVYGCGTNALRCAYLSSGTLEDFTLTGGASSVSVSDADSDAVRGGAVFANASAELWDCVISNNVASRGGAAFGGTLHRCFIEGNRASNNGIFRSAVVYDSLIVNNTGAWAFAFSGNKLYNCTVSGNSNGGISSAVIAYNSIIYGNSGTQADGSSICTNCCTGGGVRPGDGNISADPLFVDAANGDFRLNVLSPCVNKGNAAYGTGTNGTDYAGARRVYGGQVDMGAYEETSGGVLILASVSGGGILAPSGNLHWEDLPMSQTFTATPWPGRTLLFFSTNGVPIPNTGNTLEIVQATDAAITLVATFSSATAYADPTRPDDSGDGFSLLTAKRTLQSAVDLTVDGETVLAAPGVYSEGTRVTPNEKTVGYLLNRVVITNAINLRSSAGASGTVIQGAFDTVSGDPFGRGPNAVRCVYLGKGTLEGFTLTGGATDSVNLENENNRGGGVYMPEFMYTALVRDCVISNNASVRGGGTHSGTLRRCALLDNYAQNNSSGARGSFAYDCLIANNRTGGSTTGSAVGYGWCYNCTVADNEGRAGDTVYFYNSILTGLSVSGLHFDCCLYGGASGTGTTNDNCFADAPLFVDAAAGDYRLAAGSPCIDRASRAYVAEPFSTDLAGAMRMMNARVDVGAYEHDWRPAFAAALDAAGVTVTAVSPFVTYATNVAYLAGSAVYLDGNAARTNGQATVEMTAPWYLPFGRTIRLHYEVTGTGTLALYEGANLLGTATSANGYQTLKFETAAQTPSPLRFVYTIGSSDTGGALMDAFEGTGGTLFLLR